MNPKRALLVCGPTGCGKSTFIRILTEREELPEKIIENLSAYSGKEEIIEANNIMKGDLLYNDFARQLADAVHIVHYDVLFNLCHDQTRYENDPAIQGLYELEHLDIIYIKPKLEQVREQHKKREQARYAKKSPLSRFWQKQVKSPLKIFLHPQKYPVKSDKIYETDNLLAKAYAQWDLLTDSLPEKIENLNMMTIEPTTSTDGKFGFRLLTS